MRMRVGSLSQQASTLGSEPVRVTLAGAPLPVNIVTSGASEFRAWAGFAVSIIVGGALALFVFSSVSGNKSPGDRFSGPAKHARATNVVTRMDDVIGLEEAKEEVRVMVEYLKDPKRYTDMGARMPKGLLMFGPPGE